MSYGWDWHPRLIPCGIWQETGVQLRPACHFRAVDFRYRLSDDLTTADLDVRIETSDPAAARASWRLLDPDGEEVVSSATPEARLTGVRLWWPSGEGEPALYTLEVLLGGERAHTRKVGFRRVRLVMHEGAWDEPARFPKSRSLPPVTLEVNGRMIFARGSNWVCPEIFPGVIDEGVYRPLLELARDAHFNLLRTWGGAIVNKEAFYAICDELGLMVWTEFHLACNLYEGEPNYLRVLEQEAESIIRRVRQHPSLALWCGGNELFNVWSGMTDQSLPLRLLNKMTYELDRDTPFIPTAPLDGMGHGDYRFRDERGREPPPDLRVGEQHGLFRVRLPRPLGRGLPEDVHPRGRALPAAEGHGVGGAPRLQRLEHGSGELAVSGHHRALLRPGALARGARGARAAPPGRGLQVHSCSRGSRGAPSGSSSAWRAARRSIRATRSLTRTWPSGESRRPASGS
ncbi:uncharacterized protein SOCEGT47_066680 [Sorangium cellulosum]|uniref:Glycoside hydrolase family 2 immunoglobulin-like beta-sandwich domain-containing protein n=1 Tax=Sorangium cellulosum TaxID=56 RepID=A0A4P2Q9A7_SORCE|nr:hypothetical protein [Sorangium cellulosum]AUX26109.1 uncharacterized protein SOCEGT47_066680 [Sorangium cellulosum]